jgi:phosphohistidine swiveling domain-containing protein
MSTAATPSVLIDFGALTPADEAQVGGKAYVLGLLTQRGFAVPRGAVLRHLPVDEGEWARVMNWWEAHGRPALAVRSSAVGEDSEELSFAGQQKTFLNVIDEAGLREAVADCYASIQREASVAYRELFLPGDLAPKMNVILQEMVQPRFSGVFFSSDPVRKGQGWVLETITGLGEDLVSGHRDPLRFRQGAAAATGTPLAGFDAELAVKVAQKGLHVRASMGYEVDMEWAIDRSGALWVLQARPMTALDSRREAQDPAQDEIQRLRAAHAPDTAWDGQTFAEWTGAPTPLTFGLWRTAFTPRGALGRALARLGYLGSGTRDLLPHESVLERVFGRAYVNLSAMDRLFFGDIAYRTVARPRPHLQFSWRRVNARTILRAPAAILRMMRVAWRLQTGRGDLIRQAREALARHRAEHELPLDPAAYRDWETGALADHWARSARDFSDVSLEWPLTLIFLIESTFQTLRARVPEAVIGGWMSSSLHTLVADMDRDFDRARRDRSLRPFFMARYGQRGSGELDLSHPRWVELGDAAFGAQSGPARAERPEARGADLSGVSARLRPLIRQEWELLREMLELRETWKAELMRSYAHLRWMALELGRRKCLGDDVFWLKPTELAHLCSAKPRARESRAAVLALIARRKARMAGFERVSLPSLLTLQDINLRDDNTRWTGESLSPGLVYGEVRIVRDPRDADPASWPADAILVAEATDPGWTPLFLHAKGVIVEKGGVLSHCAIVAREMGLPAISGIQGCHLRLKEGEHVWLDGDNGSVRRA